MPYFDFNYSRGKRDLKDALRMCEASQHAYKNEDYIERIVKDVWGLDRFTYIENTISDSQAFVAASDKAIILAFCGTEQNKIRDWITDINFLMTDHPWGKVHSGFFNALDSIWIFIEKAIKEFRNKKQPLWITGHSLGGALASLAAAKCFSRRIGNLYGIYTFGQPRVGNAKFADKFNSLYKNVTYRFVNNEDVVSLVPFVSGYEHVGNLCYFDNSGILCQDPTLLKRTVDQLSAKIIRLAGHSDVMSKIFPNEIDDHKLDYYNGFIKKNIERTKKE